MAEEFARRRIDPIGATAEIDLVEIELEDLFLGEFGFQRHRQYRFAHLAIESAVGIEEHVARELLGDGRGRRDAGVIGDRDPERACQPDRIDPEMRFVAPVFDRNHRILHDLRDFFRAQPLAIAGAELDDLAAIARTHHDGLPDLGRLELVEGGQRSSGEGYGQTDEQHAEQRQRQPPENQPAQPQPPTAAAGRSAAATLALGDRRFGRSRSAPAAPLVDLALVASRQSRSPDQ